MKPKCKVCGDRPKHWCYVCGLLRGPRRTG